MTNIIHDFTELIGHTPLLRLANYMEEREVPATLLTKLEYFNPAGSSKDRIAWAMIREAEESGALQPRGTIIEPTSGNTGLGLAALAAARGYTLILTMPETMSKERRQLLAAYGARLVLTSGSLGMEGAINKARELAQEIPGAFMPGQFSNPANPQAHRQSTGPEIWQDSGGRVDILVAGIGTGGTISGAGGYLKEQNPALHIIGVEPAASPILSAGHKGAHNLQGIGAGFVPQTLDTAIYDEIITIREEQAYQCSRCLARCQGLLVGISSGAALAAAEEAARRRENSGRTIVVILPDGGERYLSTPLFESGTN